MIGRLLAVPLMALACGPAPSGGRGPDVLLVSIDSLRFDHLGCYGYGRDTSPVIDRLASEGVRFESAVSTTSWTLPSHAAMFTGLYDSAHGLVGNGLRLASGHRTLAEVLADAGYRTAGFFGGPYLHPTFGLDQGFDTWRSCMDALPDDLDDTEVRARAVGPAALAEGNVTGPRTVREVTRWLETLDDRPFFLFVHLWDVHYDYAPPPGYAERFDPDYAGDLDASNFEENPAIHAGMDPRDLRHLLALYDGEIRFTDEVLGQLLDAIEDRGRLERCLVVVTADHGDEFFEHGSKGHQLTLYDEVVRVPLIFRWLGQLPEGAVVDAQVRLVDLVPTILDLVGVEERGPWNGRSLTPLLRGGELEPAPALCELKILGGDRDLRSLRTENFKVVSLKGARPRGFDLREDPGEYAALAISDDRVRTGLEELRAKLASARELQEGVGVDRLTEEQQGEVLDRLRELGYTEVDLDHD